MRYYRYQRLHGMKRRVQMLYLVDVVDEVIAKLIVDLLRLALVWTLDEIILSRFEDGCKVGKNSFSPPPSMSEKNMIQVETYCLERVEG